MDKVNPNNLEEHLLKLAFGVNNLGDSITEMLIENKSNGLTLDRSSNMLIENVNINDDLLIHPSNNLNSGIYFIKIISNETNTTLKMIVN